MAMYPSKLKKPDTRIYGASWDGSSTTLWTRTDDAVGLPNPNPYYLNMSGTPSSPFDNIMPWAGMVRVSDANAGELVAIPKFYFKLDYANETNPRGLKIQISMVQHTGFLCSPAHMDRGDGVGERSVVYVGRYHCGSGSTDKYKSKTGVKPQVDETKAAFRSGIHNLGSNIWQMDYAMRITIWLLYLVEYANWDSQRTIGAGCGNNSSLENNGLTDSMPYHTGTNEASILTYGHMQYRNIEDLWANVCEWVDGIYFDGTDNCDINVIKNPSLFSDTQNGVKVGVRSSLNGFVRSMDINTTNGYKWLMFPSYISTDFDELCNTYIADVYSSSTSGKIMATGGPYNNVQWGRGLFYMFINQSTSATLPNVGSRVMKLP